jgi:hypothetical protein
VLDQGIEEDTVAVALHLRAAQFRNVLVGRDPAATLHRLVDHGNDPAVLRFDHGLGGLALAHREPQFGTVAVRISGKTAALDPVAEEVTERAAGLRDFGGKPVHLDVAPVAHDQSGLRVEHAQALGHVVERGVEQDVVLARGARARPAPDQDLGEAQSGHEADKAGKDDERPAALDHEPCRNAVHLRRRHPLCPPPTSAWQTGSRFGSKV